MHYKSGVDRNLVKIGQELGVAHLLEGSVQRINNRVRVNAQLIDARTDAHLWRRLTIAIWRTSLPSKRKSRKQSRTS